MYYAMQLVGVCGPFRVWGGLHLCSQVARAVQGICGGPLEKSLLPIEEDQLQGQVGVGALQEGVKRNSSLVSFSSVDLLHPGGSDVTTKQKQRFLKK